MFFVHKRLGDGRVIFLTREFGYFFLGLERLCDIFCCPERLGDFFLFLELGRFFLVLIGCMFFCPERLHDFFVVVLIG